VILNLKGAFKILVLALVTVISYFFVGHFILWILWVLSRAVHQFKITTKYLFTLVIHTNVHVLCLV